MCELLEKARENQGNISYYEIAKRLGISTPLMHKWKHNKSQPNGLHTLKLAELAGLEIKEAIRLVEGGFIELSLLIVTGLTGMGLGCLIRYADSLYIMLNKQWELSNTHHTKLT